MKKGTFTTVKDTEGNDACAYYAIYIAGEVGEVEAHVYGGTFKSASKVAILVGNDNTGGDGGINAKATAYISGGTFIGGNVRLWTPEQILAIHLLQAALLTAT